jgi:hypothetical protein
MNSKWRGMGSQESHVSTWAHAVLWGKIHCCWGSLAVLSMLPTHACTQTEHSRNQPFPPLWTSETYETWKLMKLTCFSCEAEHDCPMPEPYRTLSILLFLPMFFFGMVWLAIITRTHTRFFYCGYPFDLGSRKKKQVVRPVVLKRRVVRPVD